MSSSAPERAARGRINHPFWTFLPVLGLNAFIGLPVYWITFVVAFAYEETIGPALLLVFLAPIAIYAALVGLIVLFSAAWEPEADVGPLLAYGVLTSLALNGFTVGVGSIVSALNKDHGSVSADFSITTDVVLSLGLFAFAAACVALARRTLGTTAAG